MHRDCTMSTGHVQITWMNFFPYAHQWSTAKVGSCFAEQRKGLGVYLA